MFVVFHLRFCLSISVTLIICSSNKMDEPYEREMSCHIFFFHEKSFIVWSLNVGRGQESHTLKVLEHFCFFFRKHNAMKFHLTVSHCILFYFSSPKLHHLFRINLLVVWILHIMCAQF